MNRVFLEAVSVNGIVTNDVSERYILSDSFANICSGPCEKVPVDDFELLVMVSSDREEAHNVDDILVYLQEGKLGITINGNYYPWDLIKDIVSVPDK